MPPKRARPVSQRPLVIGHRGASGYVPEHTLTSYFIAIQQGADYAEPDLVMTKDGVLVARHENEIGGTTDVAEHSQFARRRTRKVIDGVEIEGWFTEDFTLAELKTLRARERIPDIRPANTRFDRQFEIPTFDEILSMIRALDAQRAAAARRLAALGQARAGARSKVRSKAGSRSRAHSEAHRTRSRAPSPLLPRPIGVYPETKHPSYFDGLELSMDRTLLQTLSRHGYVGSKAPVFIQSFEVGNLRRLRKKTRLPMVQLIEATGAPFDFAAAGDPRTYADLITPAGLADISTYADAIGPNKSLVIPRDSANVLGSPTTLVRDCHTAGLGVHPWTFRAENHFLPANLRSGAAPTDLGDLMDELQAFIAAGIDGFFTDHPDIGARAVS
jgi:glycerophosphoryl diester phosphodiesterase